MAAESFAGGGRQRGLGAGLPDPGVEGAVAGPGGGAALAERARAESWTHGEFLAACLQREVAAREAHGGESRIRAGRFPERKSWEDFDVEHQRSLKRETLAYLGTLDFIADKDSVVFLGAPGTGKTHLALGLGIRLPGRAPHPVRQCRRVGRPPGPISRCSPTWEAAGSAAPV